MTRRQPKFPTAMSPDVALSAQAATGQSPRQWVAPDWDRVREHADVIHITPAGYLELGDAIDIGPGSMSVAAGWSPGESLWFVQPPLQSTTQHWGISADVPSGWARLADA